MEYLPKYIIVHHSAARSPQPQFEAIDEWHKERGFPVSSLGFYVGYHAVIEMDGTLRRARENTERDCDAYGHNFDSLSVCLVGNFDSSFPTLAQVAALGDLLLMWCDTYNLGPEDIFLHRHFAQKSCPGSKLHDSWARYTFLRKFYDAAKTIAEEKEDPI